tara:strand:+ start:240 stop:680 length:441 start_codon:yes stop_codon:yes gene_type:complete
MYQIIKDRSSLSKKCKPCTTIEEGEAIAKRLLDVLSSTNNGVGLAANQIGIQKRVCVVNVKKPIVLINPQIVSNFGSIRFKEGCLSFPEEYVATARYANIAVKSDNHKNILFFSSSDNVLECVCVQHEIDHLDGVVMHDRKLAKGD